MPTVKLREQCTLSHQAENADLLERFIGDLEATGGIGACTTSGGQKLSGVVNE